MRIAQASLDASSSLRSSYGNEAVLQWESVWWFTIRLRCILISTSNNNNTKKEIGLHVCAASVVQGKVACDCLYIRNKYEESWAKICVISHESCPCDGVYSIHPCLQEKKKCWIILFTAACDITLTPAIQTRWFIWGHAHELAYPCFLRHGLARILAQRMTLKYREQTEQLPDSSLQSPRVAFSVLYVPQISNINSACARRTDLTPRGAWCLFQRCSHMATLPNRCSDMSPRWSALCR